MRRMPCRRYKHQDSAHELAMSPLNLSKILSMSVNPLASHPDQVRTCVSETISASRPSSGTRQRREERGVPEQLWRLHDAGAISGLGLAEVVLNKLDGASRAGQCRFCWHQDASSCIGLESFLRYGTKPNMHDSWK
jgi:hypothetical protein